MRTPDSVPRLTADPRGRVTTTTAAHVVAGANADLRTQWRLGRPLSGGYQSGAYLLSDPNGSRAVLKWSEVAAWGQVVLAAAPVVSRAREGGWPTPAWLASGTSVDGGSYVIQDVVDGRPDETITHGWLDAVLPVVDAQAGLGHDGMRDWSAFDRSVVFGDEDGLCRAVATATAEGAALVRLIETRTRPFGEVLLPDDDLVHGDLNPGNVLLRAGRVVGLIDVEALGRGTRLHDLATLATYAWLWGDRQVVDRLVRVCRGLAGTGHLEISLSAVLIGLLEFGVRNWPDVDLADACRSAGGLFETLCPTRVTRAQPTRRS